MAVKVQSGTTVASTVSTVTFALHYSEVQVVNRGTTDLFFTVNGPAPTVGGDDSYVVPSGQTKVVLTNAPEPSAGAPSATTVQLISSAAVPFTVEGD